MDAELRKTAPFPSPAVVEVLGLGLVTVLVIATVRISELAGWIELPYLLHLSLLALALGLILAKSRVVAWASHSLSLVLGAIAALVVGATTILVDDWSDKVGMLMHRLKVWWDIAREGGVTRDNLPLMLLLLFVVWLLSYLSMWLLVRSRFRWLAVAPSALWILINARYIPPTTALYYGLYLLTVALLVTDAQLKRRWRLAQRFSSLSLVLILSLAFLGIASKVPHASVPEELGSVKSALESRWAYLETTFNRYFSPNPTTVSAGGASLEAPLHTFGNEMTLKGGISLPPNPVMTLYSAIPGYLRGATYEYYTGRGWNQANPAGPFVPKRLEPIAELYSSRREITQTIVVDSPTDVAFFIGQPRSSSMTATAFFPTPMTFSLLLDGTPPPSNLPADVLKVGLELRQYFSERQVSGKASSVARPPTPGFTIKRIIRDGNEPRAVELTRAEPEPQEVAAMRWPAVVKVGARYSVISSTSAATRVELQNATDKYPDWVTDRYLQLPKNLPDSVRQLAYEITGDYGNAYDKAKAIEAYLRQMGYNVAIEAPPPNVDAVEHFLFKSREGYCTYFASAMVVMLRTVDIPARVVAGFNIGDYDLERDAYVVTEANGHAWPEVFFPEYGWVEFEPAPSQLPILREDEEIGPQEEELTDEELEAGATEDGGAVIRKMLIALVGIVLAFLLALLVWSVSLRGLAFPARAYEKMRRFGYLARQAPRLSETPFEYAWRLQAVIPARADDIQDVVTSYVEAAFGGVLRTKGQERQIERSWQRIRKALVYRSLRLSQ